MEFIKLRGCIDGLDSGIAEEVGSCHVITQATYFMPVEKGLTFFQGDIMKDCTLLEKVELNAFRPSTPSNP